LAIVKTKITLLYVFKRFYYTITIICTNNTKFFHQAIDLSIKNSNNLKIADSKFYSWSVDVQEAKDESYQMHQYPLAKRLKQCKC
jgi:hypothetical protein